MFGSVQDKLIAGGLGVALTLSAAQNIRQAFEVRDLNTTVTTLDGQINDPDTGYVARLSTCKGNQQALELAIETQNRISAEHSARSATALAHATSAVADAQTAATRAQQDAAAILTNIPTEGDVCARILSLDNNVNGAVE